MNRSSTTANEHNKATVIFTAILTVVAGGAGLAVAGIILGADYLIHGSPEERERLAAERAQRSRDRYADALAWLAADRADRAAYRQEVRDWFEADRATRGDRPSSSETFGRVAARCWHSMIVGGGRFRSGWKAGRDEARRRRTAGEPQWWKPNTSTEDPTPNPGPVPDQNPNGGAGPATTPDGTTIPVDDIVDAEIVGDVPAATSSELVPVGQDQPPAPDPRLGDYDQRLDDLHNEVTQGRNTRDDNPSPPLSALR